MRLGKVVGTVVATQKDPKLTGNKLLVIREMKLDGGLKEDFSVAVDTVGAGVGECVLVCAGSSARLARNMQDCPVDAAVVGIVDTVEHDGEVVFKKGKEGEGRGRKGKEGEGRGRRRKPL